MTDFIESRRATLKRVIGDIQNAVSYLDEAWKADGSRMIVREGAERLDDALRALIREWNLDISSRV